MITDSFSKEEGLITPKRLYGDRPKIADVCILYFSYKNQQEIIQAYHGEEVATMKSTVGPTPIYRTSEPGKDILFYLTPMGSALAGTFIQEASALTGATRFIMFGTCGCLDKSLKPGTIIVPTAAYRDEGFSYHYAKPADYIPVKNHAKVASFLKQEGLEVKEGKTWTTDAFYKETRSETTKRQQEGCLAVEMECAGCQAVCDYYGWEFYQWLFTDDSLAGDDWDIGNLGSLASKNSHLRYFALALAFAKTLL